MSTQWSTQKCWRRKYLLQDCLDTRSYKNIASTEPKTLHVFNILVATVRFVYDICLSCSRRVQEDVLFWLFGWLVFVLFCSLLKNVFTGKENWFCNVIPSRHFSPTYSKINPGNKLTWRENYVYKKVGWSLYRSILPSFFLKRLEPFYKLMAIRHMNSKTWLLSLT